MNLRQLILVLFLDLILLLNGQCQYFESGQDPARLKWYQVKTEKFQIIFPAGFEKEAQRLANSLTLVYAHVSRTLRSEPKKISVILHNFSSIGNAFVGWAPRRVEFYTMPPQDIYPQDWLNQLAIHEFRHVVQISKMNQGLSRIFYFLAGEQATIGIYGLYVPFWFTEGDAVTIETALSNSGRGRLPEFEMEMRTQVLSRKIYDYEKAVFGSYKDFVPDRYRLGYLLVAYGRKRYGAGLWESTLGFIARHPYHPTPFSRGIRRASGLTKWKYYRSSMLGLDSLWKLQDRNTSNTSYDQQNLLPKKVYTSYRYPQWLQDSLVLAQKSGLADIEQFVLLGKDGREKLIFTPGFYYPVWLSVRKDLIVWSEYGFDKRWENRRFYDIVRYDVRSRKRTRLTRNRFLFSPSLSQDASRIVAVEISPMNEYSLVILDAANGKELQRISHPGNALMLTPTFSRDDRHIVTIILTSEGKSIVRIGMKDGIIETILPASFRDITQPVESGNYIFYHGTYSGIDNIYAVDRATKKVYQVTSSRYGAFDPAISADGNRLLYAEYFGTGYNVASAVLAPESWKPLDAVNDHSIRLYEVIAAQEGGALSFDTVSSVEYPLKKYRKFTHLLNLHSWLFNANNTESLNPQFSLLSQNKLSTLTASATYLYDYNEKTGSFSADVNYKAWYPVIGLNYVSRGRRSYTDSSDARRNYSWNEQNLGISLSQPLNFTRGKYRRSLVPSVDFNWKDITHEVNVPEKFYTGSLYNLEYELTGSRLLKASVRDMRPRWGQTIYVNFRQPVFHGLRIRNLFSAQLVLLFPGLLKHHSLRLAGMEQLQGRGLYNFSSPVSYVRGYSGRFNNREFRRLSVDYKLPLLYPDLRIGPLLYLQRVKANLFYDYGRSINPQRHLYYQSFGMDLTSDMHLLNFPAPIDMGVRYIYLPESGSAQMELLINVNFYGI